MTSSARLYALAAVLVAFAAGYALAQGDTVLAGLCAVSVCVLLRWLGQACHPARPWRVHEDADLRGLWVVDE